MAYCGVEIQDVTTFFGIVAGGPDEEIDFDDIHRPGRLTDLSVTRSLRPTVIIARLQAT